VLRDFWPFHPVQVDKVTGFHPHPDLMGCDGVASLCQRGGGGRGQVGARRHAMRASATCPIR
jgi:hypothetical protein